MRKPKTPQPLLTFGALVMLASLLTACSNLALQALNTPSFLLSDHRVERDIAYGDSPHQRLDLYLPSNDNQSRNALIVFVYGGSWTSGRKESYYFVADALTREGYTVAIPDYIKYPDAVFPAFVNDIALAVAWLSQHNANAGEDQAMFLMGHSAGAHTTALLMTDPDYLQPHGMTPQRITGYIGIAGPYGFKPKEKKFKDIFANLDNFDTMRPLHYVTGTEPPALLLHGEKDTTVLPINTRQFTTKVNEMGGDARAIHYPQMGHVNIVLALSRVFDRDNTVLTDILAFLDDGLRQRQNGT